jgi:hypothetical protein
MINRIKDFLSSQDTIKYFIRNFREKFPQFYNTEYCYYCSDFDWYSINTIVSISENNSIFKFKNVDLVFKCEQEGLEIIASGKGQIYSNNINIQEIYFEPVYWQNRYNLAKEEIKNDEKIIAFSFKDEISRKINFKFEHEDNFNKDIHESYKDNQCDLKLKVSNYGGTIEFNDTNLKIYPSKKGRYIDIIPIVYGNMIEINKNKMIPYFSLVHRIVAETFCNNQHNDIYKYVHHINDNSCDIASNLIWVTPIQHAEIERRSCFPFKINYQNINI